MEKVYKYSFILTLSAVLVLCIFLYLEKNAHTKTRLNLNNTIAKMEQTIEEWDGLYSAKSVEVDKLAIENKKLDRLIKDRNEKVEMLSRVSLHWKEKYFKIKNAKQTIIPTNPEVPVDPSCEQCFLSNRIRVDFEDTKDFLSIEGFTLSNPPYAEMKVNWTKPLVLTLVLARTKTGFRAYGENNYGLRISDIELTIDKKSFKMKWYEKFIITASTSLSKNGLFVSGGFSYWVTDRLFVGPKMDYLFNGQDGMSFYGVSFGWKPFKAY